MWVAFASFTVLAAECRLIPYKLFEFLLLMWVGVSLIGFIPVFSFGLTDLEYYYKRKATTKIEEFKRTGMTRIFCWKTGRVKEHLEED